MATSPVPLYGTRRAHRAPLGPLAPILDRSSTAAQPDAETLRAVGRAESDNPFYQRLGHPNLRAFESLVAELEDADGAVGFASGMAAISGAIAAHVAAGDRVLVAEEVYGGTAAFATHDLPRFGVAVERFHSRDLADLERRLQQPAKMVVFESPINPTLRLCDVAAITALARANGALTLFDSTFAPPPIQRSRALGVDLIAHSATKFFGGHSDVLAGVVAGPHALLGPIEGWRRRTGAVLAPDAAWLLQRSWPTLALRLAAQQQNAAALAEGLQELARRGLLAGVTYPGLPDHPDRALFERQMTGGGALLAFEVPGGLDRGVAVLDRLRVIARAASLGGVESLATLPAFTTHAALTAEQRRTAGIPDGLIRIAVGLEDVDRLLGDLTQAIETTA
ncbi:MAG: aminotransferase class I/II-fold pyridoxal phosphate-dependent enzyme [Planctomycetes bacterium]|nr:aminotransferase class I/II-fold pyridoxal phosphate-dependent enzyme [Planctomycetota bacterium]